MDNYNQPVYSRKLCQILKEQVEPLEESLFELKKIQFVKATKTGKKITLLFKAWSDSNASKVKQTYLFVLFYNGVSDSQVTNELFSMMSRYVKRREELENN